MGKYAIQVFMKIRLLLRTLMKQILSDSLYSRFYKIYWSCIPSERGKTWRKAEKARKDYSAWVNATLKIHAPYDLSKREFILKRNHLFLKSKYGVWFAYVPNFGLRHLEMNGTNDRIQIEFLLRNTPNNAVLIDIGASYGYYALTFAKEKPNSTVFAFEPSKNIYKYLSMNTVENRLSNVSPFLKAVSDSDGVVEGKGSIYDFGVSYIQYPGYEGQSYKLKSITIDSYILQKGINRIDYIKIDIEGAELLALRGAYHSIEKFRPIIQCELTDAFTVSRFGYRIIDVFEFMESLGYNFLYLPSTNYLSEYGTIVLGNNISEAIAQSNEFFFVPREKIHSVELKNQFDKPIKFPYFL